MPKTRIFIVDDDPEALCRVSSWLIEAGYDTLGAHDGVDALSRMERESIDLILLDMMMPKMDGLEVCRKIREWSQIPIIMLSEVGDEDLKACVLHAGADDYVVKPCGSKELPARIEAVLRRTHRNSTIVDSPYFVSGELRVDFKTTTVTVNWEKIDLTATEFGVLREFVLNQGQLLTHRVLLHRVWGPEFGDEKEYVRVIINRLRKKLGDDPINPKYIKTLPGIGYRFLFPEPVDSYYQKNDVVNPRLGAELVPVAV